MATKAATSLGLDIDRIAPHLLKREELGSTGIGGGVAVPHARLPDVKSPFGLLARLKEQSSSIDGRAVDIVFVLLLPADVENSQLGALALVARMLKPPEVCRGLRRVKSASELYSVLVGMQKN